MSHAKMVTASCPVAWSKAVARFDPFQYASDPTMKLFPATSRVMLGLFVHAGGPTRVAEIVSGYRAEIVGVGLMVVPPQPPMKKAIAHNAAHADQRKRINPVSPVIMMDPDRAPQPARKRNEERELRVLAGGKKFIAFRRADRQLGFRCGGNGCRLQHEDRGVNRCFARPEDFD
jgi:hypothetical protein